MTSRVEEAVFSPAPELPRLRTRAVGGTLSGSQRLLFVVALLTFGFASMYTGLALLARVTPALFPGKTLFNAPILQNLQPLAVGISKATLPTCRTGLPAEVFPDGDTVICDPNASIGSHRE